MDLIRAQHLLTKIQSFLENGNGNSLSRLEKDLLKSYVIQLYDSLAEETPARQSEFVKAPEVPAPKINYPDVPPIYGTKTTIQEPEKKLSYEPETREVPKAIPEIEIPVIDPAMTIKRPEPKPVNVSIAEPVFNVVHQPEPTQTSKASSEELKKLFEMPFSDDVSGMFTRVPVASIESALGLNERIFTLNELFGGNKVLFDSTCVELNALHTYAEATDLLLSGAAKQFDWSDPARVKMAEHFIRIVARRYPRN